MSPNSFSCFSQAFLAFRKKKTERPEDVPKPRTSRFLPPPISEFPQQTPLEPQKIKQCFCRKFLSFGDDYIGMPEKISISQGYYLKVFFSYRPKTQQLPPPGALCPLPIYSCSTFQLCQRGEGPDFSKAVLLSNPAGMVVFVDFNIPGGPDPWGWYISTTYSICQVKKKKQAHVGKPSYFP